MSGTLLNGESSLRNSGFSGLLYRSLPERHAATQTPLAPPRHDGRDGRRYGAVRLQTRPRGRPVPPKRRSSKKQKTPGVRAQALLQLGRLEGLASASAEPPRESPHAAVAREFNVNERTVRRWEREAEDGDGTGRRPKKNTHQFLARREAREDALSSEVLKDRVATQRELARATGASKSTVGRQQKRLQVKHLSVFARPWMNADHLHRRVEWANRPWDTDTLSHTAWFDEKLPDS